jgi:hypothetical protein
VGVLKEKVCAIKTTETIAILIRLYQVELKELVNYHTRYINVQVQETPPKLVQDIKAHQYQPVHLIISPKWLPQLN